MTLSQKKNLARRMPFYKMEYDLILNANIVKIE